MTQIVQEHKCDSVVWEMYPPERLEALSLNELMGLYSSLQQDYNLDYGGIYEASKKLKTLDQTVGKLSAKYLGDDMDDDEDDSNQETEKNLLETVIQNAQRIAGDENGNNKASAKKRWWTTQEDQKLKKLVDQHGAKNWKKIASYFDDRSDVQCLHRWQKVLNPKLIKGPWSVQEDEIVMKLVKQNGARNWSFVAKNLPGRIGKQCRQRWHNHLNPDIKKQRWTEQEDQAIIQAHKKLGNRWAVIAKWLPGRTDNAIKNHWNSTIKRKLKMGRSMSDFHDSQAKYTTPRMKHQQPHYQEYQAVSKILFNSNIKMASSNPLSLVIPVISKDCLMGITASDLIKEIEIAIYGC